MCDAVHRHSLCLQRQPQCGVIVASDVTDVRNFSGRYVSSFRGDVASDGLRWARLCCPICCCTLLRRAAAAANGEVSSTSCC